MDKKRKEIIITVVLIIIFIFALSNSIRKIKGRFRPVSIPVTSASDVRKPSAQAGEVRQITQEHGRDHDLRWTRCPFSGKVYSSGKAEAVNLRLVGIVWDVKDPQALINGKVVQEGDNIGGIIVVKIFPDKVKLLQGDKYIEIKLEK